MNLLNHVQHSNIKIRPRNGACYLADKLKPNYEYASWHYTGLSFTFRF